MSADPLNDDRKCLGIVETSSVPAGMTALDALVKESPVVILHARPVSPAKYLIVFESDVESVRRAVTRARLVTGARTIADLILPAPHAQVMEALKASRKVKYIEALGSLESHDLATVIEAADQAAKTGDVEIIEVRLAMGLGGHAFFTMCGEVSNVEVAMEAAQQVAARRGALVDSTVISRVDPEAAKYFAKPRSPFSDFGA